MAEHFGLAPLKTEGATVPFDREFTGPNPVEPTIEPDTAVHRLAFVLCDALNDIWPYETPYRCVELAERLIAKGLAFDAAGMFDGSKVNLTDEKQVKFLANWLARRIFTGTKALEGVVNSNNGPFTHHEIHETISRELMIAGTTRAALL